MSARIPGKSETRGPDGFDVVRELRANLEGARDETASLWSAARDATEEPSFTREGNRLAGAGAAFRLHQTLHVLGQLVDKLCDVRLAELQQKRGAES